MNYNHFGLVTIYQSPNHLKLYAPCMSVFSPEDSVWVAGRWSRGETIAGKIGDTELKNREFNYANFVDNISL